MKRFFALVALVLGLASCQTEPEGLDVQMGGEVDATITVNIPETETRYGASSNSAGSIFDNVDLDGTNGTDYTVRYIFEVYYGNTGTQKQVYYTDDNNASFPVRLVPNRHYNFVAWADIVEQPTGDKMNKALPYEDTDVYYETSDLTNITLIGTWSAMDETRDAFTGHFNTATELPGGYTGASSINITLTRPFAKLRVITTDMEQLNDLVIAPTTATVEYKVAHYNAFNAFAGKVIGDSKNRNIKHENFAIETYGDNVDDKSKVLFTDYFFADDEEEVVNFTLTVYDQDNAIIGKTINFNTPIPACRNYLTTIQGNILTDGNNIKVTVEDAFENVDDNGNTTNPDYEYKTISSDKEFLAAVNTPGKYIVISDLHIANAGDTVTTPATHGTSATRAAATATATATTTIDLNGKTITVENKGNDALASVAAGNTLVITNTVDGGKIELTEGSKGAFIENNGTVVIENGNIKSNSTNDAPVIDNNGTTDITGGVIGNNAVENTQNGDVNITGGKLEGDDFDDFIDDDYTKNENNEIVMKPVIAKIGDVEYRTLQKAFDAVDNGTITLVGDVTLEETATLAEGKTVVLNLNGKTITATDYAIENFGTLKIEGNGTINGIVYCETGNTTVENGTFNAAESGKYVFLNSQGGTLTINGGTINGGSSYPIYSYDENSSLVINDVTVNATFGCVNAYGTNGSVVINGGTYQMTGVQGKTSHITYFSANVNATINGGTFKKIGDISMSAAGGGGICANGVANLTINGGEFAGDYADVYNYGGTICIKGGSYKFEPNPAFVPKGGEVTEANGVWTVSYNPYYDYENVANGLYKKDKTYVAINGEGLVALSGMTIKGGEIVTLGADIDLTDVEFNGLNAFNPETNNTFDGNNYTVSNWTYNGGANDMAFIKSWVGTIKNVNFDNCNLKTGGRSAVVAANTYCQIDNVHVSNSTLTSTWWACGMIAGLYNYGSVSNCTVTDCSISSTGGVGAIVGVFNETDGIRTITNCEVEGCTITCTNENESEPYYAGAAMVGLINLDYSTIKFIDCKQSNNTYEGMFCKDELYGYTFSKVVIE